jgi:hypothetical protein
LQALVHTSSQEEVDSAAKLRLFADILGNPNIDDANKDRVQSVMASLIQTQLDAINADVENP